MENKKSYIIIYETSGYTQWVGEENFDKFENAKKFLKDKGYKQRDYVFYKEPSAWSTGGKAYIKGIKKFD